MGFPTANLKADGDVLVGDGVYATEAIVLGERVPGMSHLGRRPTFGLEERTVETHLANVYSKLGVRSKVELIRRATEFMLNQ